MGDDKENKGGIGFSGISSLLPDDPPDAAAQQSEAAAHPDGSQSAAVPPSSSATGSTPSKPPAAAPQPQQSAPQTGSSGGGAVWAWIGGIAVVIFVIWAVSQSGTQPTSQSASRSPAALADSSTQPSTATQDEQASDTATSQPTDPVLQTPPIGTGNVFSVAEIRYCLVLERWVKAAQPVVDTYKQDQVDRFNKMVDDYNGRCHNFQYRTGDLEQAQRDVAPYAQRFQTLSRQWVQYGEAPGANTSEVQGQSQNQSVASATGSGSTQPSVVADARSTPHRTRHSVPSHGDLASARDSDISVDAAFVHARQLGNCSPTYPVDAARSGRSGTTTLAIRVGTDGGVTSVQVVTSSGSSALDRAAVDAMERCQFVPATRNGLAVVDELRIPVSFTFKQKLVVPDATGVYQ